MTQVLQTKKAAAVTMSFFLKQRVNSHSFKLFRDYYKSHALPNVGELIEEQTFVFVCLLPQ